MKTKLVILSGLVVVGVGIWYLFLREQSLEEQEGQDPVGPIHKEEESYQNHLRQILHKAKVTKSTDPVAASQGNTVAEPEGNEAVPVA
jgi:hypothetical protein